MAALPDWKVFASSDALAHALADAVAAALDAAIAQRGQAFLAVSGGTTPGRFFQALSQKALDWSKVTVTLVDERLVPESSPRSNAALVRKMLLTNKAATARLQSLYRPAESVEDAARQASADLALLSWPLDVAILGMGTDGHTASFFPDAGNLDRLLDPESSALILPVDAPSAGEERLTLPLARLLEAGLIALHIEGDDKKAVLEAALRPGEARPISAVFAHGDRPVPVYWTQ